MKSIFKRNLSLTNYQLEYVKKVIAQSGAAVADWAFVRNPLFMRNTSVVAGYSYGCRTRHTFNLVECLKSRSAIDFTTTEVKVNKMDFILTFIIRNNCVILLNSQMLDGSHGVQLSIITPETKNISLCLTFPKIYLWKKKSILIRNSLICQALREMKDQPLSVNNILILFI